MLLGLLVGDERDYKNINKVSKLAKFLDHGERDSTLIIIWKTEKETQPQCKGKYWKSHISWT